ncbi:MAG: hypothetical protein ACREFA_09845 [Stellaceae bacterium]
MADRIARDAVAAFPDTAHLQNAVDELMVNGFDRALLSVMPPNRDIERRFGPDWRVADIADDPATPRVGFVGLDSRAEGRGLAAGGLGYLGAAIAAGAVIASGGALALVAGLAAAAGIGGGMIGKRLGRSLDTHYGQWLGQQQQRGGILLWVRTLNAEAETRACEILKRRGGSGVRIVALRHRVPRRSGGVSADLAWVNKPLSEALDR